MKSDQKFYVTTPIYYVTAGPHIGSLYTTTIADVIARWQRLLGKNVFFLTGTDEHGHKVAQAAHKASKNPQLFVDEVSKEYKAAWDAYNLSYSDFIRTTDERHKKGVYHWFDCVLKKGEIYKGRYDGWYCLPEETFVAEKDVLSTGQAPLCPSCGRLAIAVSEENYFFKLSDYQERLLDFYKNNPDFIIPKERLNEIISFVQSGLKDLCISRKNLEWAIPFPLDPSYGIYVWVDALMNYATGVGYGQEESHDKQGFNYWWPADVHIMAKEIARFHAIYWPALLMAADLPLPKQLLVHGWLTVDGQKMSKSLGNVLDPYDLSVRYGVEQVKYYLLRHLPITQDSDFSHEGLKQCINADLADDLGNLLNRLVALAQKLDISVIPAPAQWSLDAQQLYAQAQAMFVEFGEYMSIYSFHMAYSSLWKFINQVNAFFHAHEPWKLAKKDHARFMEILSATCHALRTISVLAWPVMPEKMQQLQFSLGIPFDIKHGFLGGLSLKNWDAIFTVTKIPALFEKIETESEKKEKIKTDTAKEMLAVDIETLAQVELVVGTIEQVESIEKSDKLLKLLVNFGDRGMRTILAGIRALYTADQLMGKQAIFVYNLKPRKMLGYESQGMLLIAQDPLGAHFVQPAGAVANGTRLK